MKEGKKRGRKGDNKERRREKKMKEGKRNL